MEGLMSIDLVLCATDLSREEGAAWRSAARLLRRLNARARILHVIEPVPFPYPSEGPGIGELQERLRSDLLNEARRVVRARLHSLPQEWAEDLRPEKIEAVIALEGIAAETILLEAERAAADMILVFSRRRGPLRRLLLGSVAQQVVSDARIPVVVLPIAGGTR
jgi:nucleotide-binding universal stress UspA family protein